MAEHDESQNEAVPVPLRYQFPEALVSRYATQITVQHTDSEFIVSFYEVLPPVLVGTPEENRAQVKQLEAVDAVCLARIILSPQRMANFVKAISDSFESYMRHCGEPAE